MQHVAAEMQRDDYFRIKKIPLLIGGATTSRVHTAVKISPHYEGPVVYVPDASRSVSVCSDLLCDDKAAAYIAELNADYERVREQHANKKATPLVTLAAGARQQDADRLGDVHAAGAEVHRPPRVPATTTWPRSPHCIDWAPVLPDLGPGRPLPGDPDRRRRRRVGAARAQRRPAHAQAPDRGPLAARPTA